MGGPDGTDETFCNPYWWLQGHGIWHFGTALSSVSLFRYFQDERIYIQLPMNDAPQKTGLEVSVSFNRAHFHLRDGLTKSRE
jgi:hypothetical protein